MVYSVCIGLTVTRVGVCVSVFSPAKTCMWIHDMSSRNSDVW